MKEQEDTGLHSEKVRKILGDIPPTFIRWSVAVLSIISISLIVVFCLLDNKYIDGETILHRILGI